MNLAELESIQDLAAVRQVAYASLCERDAIIHRHAQELHYRQTKIDALLFELARLKRWRYSAQSEQRSAPQRRLFEEGLEEDIRPLEQTLAARDPRPDERDPSPGTQAPNPAGALGAHRAPL